jgi:tetratricopeptide (TPR) repeat protein
MGRCGVVLACLSATAAAQSARSQRAQDGVAENAAGGRAGRPVAFAPVPADHPLAGVWNDPDFARRLAGSYGFLSEAEPRLNPEEQVLFRDKIVPLLREEPSKAIAELQAAQKPGASAVFDFTLGTVYFQTEDFTNAVKQYEQALAKFPDYRRAQRNLALSLVRSGRYSEAIRPLTRTLELGGADGKIFGLLGFAHLSEGRLVSAEGAYKQAMVYEPDNLDYQLGLVKCFIGLQQLDAAVAMLDEMIQRYPEKENLWALQANAFHPKGATEPGDREPGDSAETGEGRGGPTGAAGRFVSHAGRPGAGVGSVFGFGGERRREDTRAGIEGSGDSPESGCACAGAGFGRTGAGGGRAGGGGRMEAFEG